MCRACMGRSKQHRAKRTQSGVPVLADEGGSGPVGAPTAMPDAAKRERAYMAEQGDPKLPNF